MEYYDLRFQLREELDSERAFELSGQGMFFDSVDGVPHISITVEADSASKPAALFEANRRLEREDVRVLRAVPNLVTIPVAASRFDTSRQAAQRWKNSDTFPTPVITDGVSLWYWPEVREWVKSNRRRATYDDCVYPDYSDYAVFNGNLASTASAHYMNTVSPLGTLHDFMDRYTNSVRSVQVDGMTKWTKSISSIAMPHSPRFHFYTDLNDEIEEGSRNGNSHRV